jgi:hypothetical protein
MTAPAAARALLVAAVCAGAGCMPRPRPVDFSDAPREYVSKDYPDVYDRWTRQGVTRHDVDIAIEAWATFKSWDYREAYIEHYATLYNLSEADRRELRDAQMESYKTAYEFHVTAQSSTYKWNDLERKSSPWRISLIDGLGNELTPEYVRLEKLPPMYEIEFFPSKGPFTRSYAVRFLKPTPGDRNEPEFVGPRTGSLILRLASPLGRVDLTWQGG